MSTGTSAAHKGNGAAKPSIAIIGTGFGGLAAAIELKKAGYDDLVLFERADDVGGVWRENTYPGAACDVPSPYYSYSFEPNPNWPRRFSEQPDILEYLRGVADKYDIKRHIRFNTEVAGADFDESTGRWTVHTSEGDAEVDHVISAVGQLSRPSWPNIKGRETFAGASFHSAKWDHDVDLFGKRVAVIGTGASAIQFVPQIQPSVAKLELFQRTPPHILPRPDTVFSPSHLRMFEKVPLTQRFERVGWFGVTESLSLALLYARPLSGVLERAARLHLNHQVKDEQLRAKLWPSHEIGCKRILFASNYFPALTQPNVDVVTDGIVEITPEGVRTDDGVLHEVDVIIYGTGFTANDFLAPLKVHGLGGRDLREEWRDGAQAYLGISAKHFPNLHLMYGPNTNVGGGSIVTMLESQAGYIRQAIAQQAIAGAPIVIRESVADEFDEATQKRLVNGVWSTCNSWYRGPNGRISTNWPGMITEYVRRTAKFDARKYETVAPGRTRNG